MLRPDQMPLYEASGPSASGSANCTIAADQQRKKQ